MTIDTDFARTAHVALPRDTTMRHRSPAPRIVAASKRTTFQQWWIAFLVIPMMMASDFKFRRRSASSALGGSPDAQVLIEVAVYGLVALYLVLARGRAPRLRRTTPMLFTMWFFSSALAASSLWAVYPKLAVVRAIQVMIVCALAQTIATRATVAHMHRFAHAYMGMLSLAVLSGHAKRFPLNHAINGRFHWLYFHPVPGAIYLMIGTLMAVAYMRSEEMRDVLKIWPRWMYTAVGVWIALALLLTKTRGSLAGCLVGLIVLAALHTRASTKFDIGALATLFITFVTVGFGSAIISYLERGQDISKLSTLNERTNLWAQAFQEFKVRPIFGDGLGASRGIFLDTIGLGGGHNAFVNVLVDAGLLGTLPFVALLAMVGFALYRFRRGTDGFRDAVLLLPIFCGLIVNSMTAEFMAVPANNASIWLFLFVAWIAVLRRTETPAYTPRVMTR